MEAIISEQRGKEFEYPQEEEGAGKKRRTDPLHLYLKNIGARNMALLSRDEEYSLAKTIETAYFEMAKVLFSNDFGLDEFRKLFKRSKIIQIEKFIRIGVPVTQDVLDLRKKELSQIMKKICKKKELRERDEITQQMVEFDLQYSYLDEIEEGFRKLMEMKEDEKIKKKTGLSREVLVENLEKIDVSRQIIISAVEIMFERNLKLSICIAKKFEGRGVELNDLISVGNDGLRKVITIFDYRRKYRFSTCAGWWIRHEILKLISQQGEGIRLPVNLQVDMKNLNFVLKELKSKLKREIYPTGRDLEKIAKRMKLSPERVKEIISVQKNMIVSIESPIDDEGSTVGDLIPEDPEEGEMIHLHNVWAAEKVMEILEGLRKERKISEDDYKAFTLRFPLDDKKPMELEKIGVIFNLTRERIRQKINKVLKKLSYYKKEIKAATYHQ